MPCLSAHLGVRNLQIESSTRIHSDERLLCHDRSLLNNDIGIFQSRRAPTTVCRRCSAHPNEHHVPHTANPGTNRRVAGEPLLLRSYVHLLLEPKRKEQESKARKGKKRG